MREMTIIAARPSMGKSAFMLQMARHMTKSHPVGIISMEMSSESLLRRMASSGSKLDLMEIRNFKDQQMIRLTAEMMRIKDLPLYIYDQDGLSIREIKSITRQWVVRHGIKVLMVDYLQRARGSSKRAETDRRIEVEEISSELKKLAMDLNLAVVALCQLNRDVEKRGGRPRKSDLKEASGIEQDADMIVFLWSSDNDDEDIAEQIDNPNTVRKIHVTLDKNRNGPIGDTEMVFLKKYQIFEPVSRISVPEEYYNTHK